MTKIIDTSGPEWSTKPPRDLERPYWMHSPGEASIDMIRYLCSVGDLGHRYETAFGGMLFSDEIPEGTKFALVADPPGCVR